MRRSLLKENGLAVNKEINGQKMFFDLSQLADAQFTPVYRVKEGLKQKNVARYDSTNTTRHYNS